MNNSASSSFRTQNIEWQARLQGVPLASFQSRAAAFLIDALIVAVLLFAPSIVSMLGSAAAGHTPPTLSLEFGSLLSVAVAVLYFAVSSFLGRGATLGKRLLGIRVVSLVHDHLTLWHCIERTLGYTASFLEAGFGFLQYFTHPNRQTVHDRIAETIVIVTHRAAAHRPPPP